MAAAELSAYACLNDEYVSIIDRIKKGDTRSEDFEENVWNAAVFVIVKDIPRILAGEAMLEQWLRFVFISICSVLNAGLQLCLVFWIVTKITLPSITSTQTLYAEFHRVSFDDGRLDTDMMRKGMGEDVGRLCQFGMAHLSFLIGILFLWLSQCAQEMKDIERWNRRLLALPRLPRDRQPHDMVYEVVKEDRVDDHGGHFSEEKWMLCCLDCRTRFLIYMLMVLPRLLICSVLALSGSQWLIASETGTDLLLNSLALVFVVQVDETIYSVFLPVRMNKALAKLKFEVPLHAHLGKDEKERNDILTAYQRSFIYLLAVCVVLVLVIRFQVILPGYAQDIKSSCLAVGR
jgi:hypothetical protein